MNPRPSWAESMRDRIKAGLVALIRQAQSALGFRYATGRGLAQNNTETVKRLRKAAERGEPDAQSALSISPSSARVTRRLLILLTTGLVLENGCSTARF